MTDPNEKKAEAFDEELEDFDDTADDKPEDAFEEADGNDAVSEPTEELEDITSAAAKADHTEDAFSAADESSEKTSEPEEKEEEVTSVFADALPEWDVMPPAIMVERRR